MRTAASALRKSVSEADLTKILGTIAARLGKVKSSKKSGWNINFQTSGTFVTLGFNTDFEKGAGTEQFVYHVSGNTAKLVSYNVNSPALLLN